MIYKIIILLVSDLYGLRAESLLEIVLKYSAYCAPVLQQSASLTWPCLQLAWLTWTPDYKINDALRATIQMTRLHVCSYCSRTYLM